MEASTINKGISKSELLLDILVILFVFQAGLANLIPFFSYVDEVLSFSVLFFCLGRVVIKGVIKTNSEFKMMTVFLVLYVTTGILGNLIYQYQNSALVLVDVFTNIKFYLAMGFAFAFIKQNPQTFKTTPKLGRMLSVVLFALFIADYLLSFFPHGYRFGLKNTQLFFGHPTYLAGCCVFLIALLAYYGAKNNIIFILINLVMMAFTLRGKAIAGAIMFLMLYFCVITLHSKLKLWQIVILAILGIAIAWTQIYFYYIELAGQSARSVMLITSLSIMKDYFPIGTGFGTYGSHAASVNYSPVYVKYGFRAVYELRGTGEASTFFDDQFWPIIFGQTGVIGTIFYCIVLVLVFSKIQKLRKFDANAYLASIFSFFYLIISSTSEPAFNNLIATPISIVLSMSLLSVKKKNRANRFAIVENKMDAD